MRTICANNLNNELYGENRGSIRKYTFKSTNESLDPSELRDIDISLVENRDVYTTFKDTNGRTTFPIFKEALDGYINENGEKLFSIKEIDGNPVFVDSIAKINKIKDINSIYDAMHEITHLVMNNTINSSLRSGIESNFNQLVTNINKIKETDPEFDIQMEITNQETGERSVINLSEVSLEHNRNIDPNFREEIITSFYSTLIANNFIKANKKVLAKIFSNNNDTTFSLIDDNNQVRGFRFTGDDTNTYLTTLDQLEDFKQNNGIHTKDIFVNKLSEYNHAIFNSSHTIKEALFGSKESYQKYGLDEHNKILSTVTRRINLIDDKTKKLHRDFFKNLHIAKLLDLTSDEIVFNQAMALHEGFNSRVLEKVNFNREQMEKLMKDIDPVDFDQVDDLIGHMTIFGLNLLNNDINPLSGARNNIFSNVLNRFNTDYIIKSLNKRDPETSIKLVYEQALENIFKDVSNIHGKDIANRIETLISNASKGDIDSFNSLIQHVKDIVDSQNRRTKITVSEAKLIARKLTSIKAIAENADKDVFKDKFKRFANMYSDPTKTIKINNILKLHNQILNDHNIFGENIELKFLEESKNLRLVDDKTGIPESYVIAEVNQGDKTYYAVIGDRYNTTIGKQDSMAIDFDLNEFQKGVYERNLGEVSIKLNAQNMKLHQSFIDKRLSTQFYRNSYINEKQKVASDLGYTQWRLLRESNILMTKDEVNKAIELDPTMEDKIIKLPSDHPFSKVSGVDLYVNSYYEHHLLGTQGINLKNGPKALGLNDKSASALGLIMKNTIDLIRELSKALLLVNPKILIGNYAASISTYGIHAKGGFTSYLKYHIRAKKMNKQYKELLNDLYTKETELNMLNKNDPNYNTLKQEVDELNQKVKEHPLTDAFENGLSDTLRTTSLQIGNVEDLTLYQWLKHKFGKTTSARAKMLLMNDNSKFGRKMGDIFNEGELIPKLALYLNKLDEFGSQRSNEALQYTIQSFPRYNNLPQSLALLDAISPYTKFFLSTPRIAAWAFIQHPVRYGMLAGAMYGLPQIQDEDDQNKWYLEHGFLDLYNGDSTDFMINMHFLDQLLHPIDSIQGKPFAWDIFGYANKLFDGATGDLETLTSSFTPLTIIDKGSH